MKETSSDESLVIVARAIRTRGLKGEIVAELLTDFPERFAEVRSLIAVSPDGVRKTAGLESFWFQQDRVILKLTTIDSVEAAKELVGFEFAVPEAERVELPEGSYYDWELEGCSVFTSEGSKIGRVSEVTRLGGEIEMLTVATDKGKTHMIPMVDSIVKKVDLSNHKVLIDPPEGLLEL